MKVAYKKGTDVTLKDEELRALSPGEIKIHVDACGICGTDLHIVPEAENSESGFGHEMAGTILEAGQGVTRFEVGQRVAVESSTPCGKCLDCRDARQELCTDMKSFFMLRGFGFAEEALVPEISAIPLDDDMSADVACLSEPLGVAIDMVRLAEIELRSNVLIMGPGAIGLMAVALARRGGARRVFVSGHSWRTGRMRLAKEFGADAFIDPGETELTEYDFGCEIDRILVTAPPSALPSAFDVACKGAIVSFIGIEHGDGAFCRFDVNAFHFKKLQLRASFASPAMFTPLALKYLHEGVVNGEALISHRFKLDEIGKAMNVARKDPEAVKVVITS